MIPKSRGDFWQNVQFGGGVGLGFESNYTDISLAPSAIYNFNEYIALGLGLNYLKSKKITMLPLYGGSIIWVIQSIPVIQLSAELEDFVLTSFRWNKQ
jgi:hypothetical protein